ncbi:MAG: hypothetical protein JJ899_13500 [Alphaproteobacteria bacterium]|nr:hypothetical protein [Alphaproteobacteria bacterium]
MVVVVIGMIEVAGAELYRGADGEWAAWNATSILRYSDFADPSPFSLLIGTGSIQLPNLPWFNPGALALGLPFGTETNYILSYIVYFLELALSMFVLARVLGINPTASHFCTQLYLLVFFLPFAPVFEHDQWYNAAPVYAHIVSLLNVILALYLAVGRDSARNANLVCILLMALMAIVAVFSGPFILVFFGLFYAAVAVAVTVPAFRYRTEALWKVGAAASVLTVLVAMGYPDYLLTTAGASARAPAYGIDYGEVFARENLLGQVLNFHICSSAQTQMVICAHRGVYWFSLLAICGAVGFLLFGHRILSTVSAAYLVLVLLMQAYATLQALALVPPALTVLSPNFLIWSSFPLGAVMIAGLVPAMAKLFGATTAVSSNGFALSGCPNWGQRLIAALIITASLLVLYGSPADPTGIRTVLQPGEDVLRFWGWFVAGAFLLMLSGPFFRIPRRGVNEKPKAASQNGNLSRPMRRLAAPGAIVMLAVAPFSGYTLLDDLSTRFKGYEKETPAVVLWLRDRVGVRNEDPFQGYVSTFWSEAFDTDSPISGQIRASGLQYYRYALARHHFRERFGSTLTEYDLAHYGIPTFEEYGQWVTRQAQRFTTRFLVRSKDDVFPTFLRIYRPDRDIMALLGIRYLLSDANFDGEDGFKLLRTEHSIFGDSVNLYELINPNLATYSPSRLLLAAPNEEQIFKLIEANRSRLSEVAIVTDMPTGASTLSPATNTELIVESDGFRFRGKSGGISAVVLPVQYSRCLDVTSVHAGAPPLAMQRVNYLQTLIVFDREIDVSVEFDFGYVWKTGCRRSDSDELQALQRDSKPTG